MTWITWNPNDKGANISLSELDLKATNSGAWNSVRATASISSGTLFFVVSVASPTSTVFVGFANASASLGNYLGADINGWGYDNVGGYKRNNGSYYTYGTAYGAGSKVKMEAAFSGGTATLTGYLWNGSDWVSQGTMYTGVAGPLYPSISLYTGGNTTTDFTGFGSLPPIASVFRASGLILPRHNPDFNGLGSITGITEVQTGPSTFSTLAACVVTLYDTKTKRPIAKTVSGSDGTYTFTDLNPAQSYFAVAFDPAGDWDAVATRFLTTA